MIPLLLAVWFQLTDVDNGKLDIIAQQPSDYVYVTVPMRDRYAAQIAAIDALPGVKMLACCSVEECRAKGEKAPAGWMGRDATGGEGMMDFEDRIESAREIIYDCTDEPLSHSEGRELKGLLDDLLTEVRRLRAERERICRQTWKYAAGPPFQYLTAECNQLHQYLYCHGCGGLIEVVPPAEDGGEE